MYGGLSILLITLSGILLTTLTSFARVEMNQSASKMSAKLLIAKKSVCVKKREFGVLDAYS